MRVIRSQFERFDVLADWLRLIRFSQRFWSTYVRVLAAGDTYGFEDDVSTHVPGDPPILSWHLQSVIRVRIGESYLGYRAQPISTASNNLFEL